MKGELFVLHISFSCTFKNVVEVLKFKGLF